jgi:hypothetical protein
MEGFVGISWTTCWTGGLHKDNIGVLSIHGQTRGNLEPFGL